MDFHNLLWPLIALPLIGAAAMSVVNDKKEWYIASIGIWISAIHFLLSLGIILTWGFQGFHSLNISEWVIYRANNYEFVIDFYFNTITAVYLFMGSALTHLVLRYSRTYMHLEHGFKRFFITIMFFAAAFNLTILAGNFETLFVGWEMLGISSFLLIAFYRNRLLPVRNAVRVFSIYRIADIGIILAMWSSHHLWHENITFSILENASLVESHLMEHPAVSLIIALGLVLAAAAKSAQFPFSSWLPRAMEGPTPSSAIFYGALSVHLGVFLLLRTQEFWHHLIVAKIVIAAIGLFTAFIGFHSARVQSTIKAQIAYASVTQIGLMFVELALGLDFLVLIHFVGNAFLRMYQLLISPSIVAYQIRDQHYNEPTRPRSLAFLFPSKLVNSIFVLAIKEWNLDRILNEFLFGFFKKLGRSTHVSSIKAILFVLLPLYVLLVVLFAKRPELLYNYRDLLAVVMAFIALLLVLRAFVERKNPILAFALIVFNHFWMVISVSLNDHFDWAHTTLFISGILVFGALGLIVLWIVKQKVHLNFDLVTYHGYHGISIVWAFLFFLSVLGIMGFPISPTFIGEDLIFSHIHSDQILLAVVNSIVFVFSGITLIRIYARLFLGTTTITHSLN